MQTQPVSNANNESVPQTPEGYYCEAVTIDATKANVKAVSLMLPVAAIIAIPYYVIWQEKFTMKGFRAFRESNEVWFAYGTLIALGVIIAGVVLHELIHGITWARFAKRGFRSISFGVLWKQLTPYCHCSEPLSVREYIIGAIMPAVVLGFLPSLWAYVSGDIFFLLFGLFFTVAAAGDFMIIDYLRREKSTELVQDHPTEIGYFIFRKKDENSAAGVNFSQ